MADEIEKVTVRDFDRFIAAHIKDHERVDAHLSLIHRRMWGIAFTIILGLLSIIAFIIKNSHTFSGVTEP